MRHFGQIHYHRLTADGFAQSNGQLHPRFLEILAGQQFTQIDRFTPMVGQFNTNGIAPLHHRHARRNGRHRTGNIIGQTNNARRFNPRGRFKLIERHHRAGPHIDNLTLDAEILQNPFQQAGILLQRIFRNAGDRLFFGIRQQRQLRQGIGRAVEKGGLRLLQHPLARFERRGRRRNARMGCRVHSSRIIAIVIIGRTRNRRLSGHGCGTRGHRCRKLRLLKARFPASFCAQGFLRRNKICGKFIFRLKVGIERGQVFPGRAHGCGVLGRPVAAGTVAETRYS